MNPAIPADYEEGARWLRNFATSHAKREDSRAQAHLEREEAREGRSYGLRLVLGPTAHPPRGEPPLELGYAEVVEGRTHLAWCHALAERIRASIRQLAGRLPAGAHRSA
ncbi:MAG: hypothetical protein ACRELA_17175 [Candidatus Rokuibacteriota bacterium]